MAAKPKYLNVPPSHEELRRELVAAVVSFQGLPPLERLAVIAIVLGQQVALTEGYDRKNVMNGVAANVHYGATEAIDARKIITF